MKPIEQIADYKEAAEVLNQEYLAMGWHGTKIHGGHKMRDESGWEHFAFQVEFAPPSKPHPFFDWKQGTGLVDRFKNPKKPNPAEVLGRCCADYRDASGRSFDSWAGDFGYETDSRKAFRVYEDCLAIGSKLKSLGLAQAQISRFADLASML